MVFGGKKFGRKAASYKWVGGFLSAVGARFASEGFLAGKRFGRKAASYSAP